MLTYQRQPVRKSSPYFFSRTLGSNSEVTVRVGDVVQPETVLSAGWKKSGFRTFNLAQLFGVEADKAGVLLKRTVGTRVYKGDVLAGLSSMWGLKEKVFKSPLNGVIIDYDHDHARLTLQYLPTEVKTVAGVYGRVVKIISGESVDIGTRVDLLRGVVAFGVDREGSLVEVGYPDIPIQPDQILPKHVGKIIFGGTKISIDALYKALSVGVRVVITGGVDYRDYVRLVGSQGRFENVGISVLATEGFGASPIYAGMYDLLQESEHRQAYFNPHDSTIVLPLPQSTIDVDKVEMELLQSSPSDNGKFGLLVEGSKVRILSSHNFGAYGIVSDLTRDKREVEIALANKTVVLPPESTELILE